jgi:hypothetical protein
MVKKLVLISLVWLLLSGVSFSQSTVKNSLVGITWDQPMQIEITGWNVFASKVQGSGYSPISSIMYNPASGVDIAWRDQRWPDMPVREYQGVFTIPNAMLNTGKMERFYFVMVAQWSDRTSINSNEIYFDVDLRTAVPPTIKCTGN